MRTPVSGRQFRKDVRLAEKRGRDMSKLRAVLEILLAGDPLPVRCHDHALTGEWVGYRDCHIEPDWLLIYGIEDNDLVLVRTGTHADLFR